MNVLLVNPIDKKTYNNSIRFPLGLSYISDALSSSGHNVEILDLAIGDWNLASIEALMPNYSSINAIGMTGLITEYKNIKDLSRIFKKSYPDKTIVLGGALATRMPKEILDTTDIDIVTAGEGEITAKELFRELEKKGDISAVRGIYLKRNGDIIHTGERKHVSDLNQIGFPTRKGFNVESYFSNSPLAMFGSKRTLNMITSRGCPYNCFYCDKVMWGNFCRLRSPENIVSEIKYLIGAYRIDSVIFHDDTFNIDKKRLLEFCDILSMKKIRLNWLAHCRVNNITYDIARRMRKAGCRMIGYGIESGNQDILNSMRKSVNIRKASEAIKATWKAKIVPFAYLMIGWFNETKIQALDTVKFCIDNKVIGDFSFFTPSPHTPAFEKAQAEGKVRYSINEILYSRGEWHKTRTINVSSIPDEEVAGLKKYAERKIMLGNIFGGGILNYLRALGFLDFSREIMRRLIRYGINGFKVRCE